MRSTNAIMYDAYECLIEKLGVVETEVFISTIKREKFDYTEWRKGKFDGKSLDDLLDEAVEYAEKHHAD